MTKEEIQKEIDILTTELKSTDGDDLEYGRLWNRRVALKAVLSELDK